MENKKKWEEVVKEALRDRDKIEIYKRRRELREYYAKLKRFIPIPLITGIVAAYFMYRLYGSEDLLKSLLGWVIGLTLIATIIASLPGKIRRN